MATLPSPQVYPPRIYNCKLRQLCEEHPDKPNVQVLAAYLGVTPLTMSRIMDGIDLKLDHAFNLSKLFGKSIEEIWERKSE